MSNFKRAIPATGGPSTSYRSSILSTLKATSMVDSKPVLPAEIISTILDYLPIPDLMRFARTAKRMQEMVYEDSRWVQRLQVMGLWNEGEARRRFEEGVRRKRELMRMRAEEEGKRIGIGVTGGAGQVNGNAAGGKSTSTTLFDAGLEEDRQRANAAQLPGSGGVDGFTTLTLSSTIPATPLTPSRAPMLDPEALLNIFAGVRSIRGAARQEFGTIYAALAPFYFDLARSRSHVDPVIFRVYRDPEQQAQMLAHLQVFAKCDWAQGWRQREEKLNNMVGIFENAVLREFEHGYEAWDVDGRMRRYAHVLGVLNGGHAGIELFVQKHPLFTDENLHGNPMDCINQAASGSIALEPARELFQALSKKVNEQSDIIDRVFPPGEDVLQILLVKIAEDILMEYVIPLFDEAHERSIPSYLQAVAGIFEQSMFFLATLKPTKNSGKDFHEKAKEILGRVFEPHVDLYLQDELDHFKQLAEAEVSEWENKLSAEDATTESFFMANVNRQADKKDFLSSFKKVVMMPVNVLPSLPLSSPFASSKSTAPMPAGLQNPRASSPYPSRTHSPNPISSFPSTDRLPSPAPSTDAPPTTELAAKAALMASRLAGIKSLFSVEIALNLTHAAKTSINRASLFTQLPGAQTSGEAREQCSAIFVLLLQILGSRHIKDGFDLAVAHLSAYNPRAVSTHHTTAGVAPLVTFLELVNVGDLISQMIDVFFEQQLVAVKLADRNDFLDPAGKAKKKFEQMLDERVAAGLNKGIDVLMDEVEFLCATTQLPTDYNPPPPPGTANGTANPNGPLDIGPTPTAQHIVRLVADHTRMLTGSTDKSMLDVFHQEVGLRLFSALCKHLKRQRISTTGAMALISDMNLMFEWVQTLRNSELLLYFRALREVSQVYLIDKTHAREIAEVVADGERWGGVWRAEEVLEFVERRADWLEVRREVERAMYGIGCVVM